MSVPNGVIFIWTGTNASIPSGWSRVTDLDGKHPKGTADSTNPNATGGNATHSHTSPSHTHTMDAHTHSVTIPAVASDAGAVASGTTIAIDQHSHGPFTSGAVDSSSISSVTSTYSAISNDPPYYEVIFITPTTGAGGIPDQAVYYYSATDSLTGHYICDGNNSTPNLVDKYLKGAGTGGNAGGTGGSTTNIHELTHSHTVSHSHAQVTSTSAQVVGNSTSGGNWMPAHTHTVSLDASTTAPSTNPSLTTSETVEPEYRKLLAVQNRTGSVAVRRGVIGLWLGTLSTIPSNYKLCDGTRDTLDMRGKYAKVTATNGDINATGGSNTHTHASQAHSHTVSHTHTGNPSTFTHTNTNRNRSGSGANSGGGQVSFNHSSATVSTENYVLANANTTADSSNNEPEYRTVAYIQYDGERGGAFLFNLIR